MWQQPCTIHFTPSFRLQGNNDGHLRGSGKGKDPPVENAADSRNTPDHTNCTAAGGVLCHVLASHALTGCAPAKVHVAVLCTCT
jgi:hypothetical protein